MIVWYKLEGISVLLTNQSIFLHIKEQECRWMSIAVIATKDQYLFIVKMIAVGSRSVWGHFHEKKEHELKNGNVARCCHCHWQCVLCCWRIVFLLAIDPAMEKIVMDGGKAKLWSNRFLSSRGLIRAFDIVFGSDFGHEWWCNINVLIHIWMLKDKSNIFLKTPLRIYCVTYIMTQYKHT